MQSSYFGLSIWIRFCLCFFLSREREWGDLECGIMEPPEELRCQRNSGSGWRCKHWRIHGQPTCEEHYLYSLRRNDKRKRQLQLCTANKKAVEEKVGIVSLFYLLIFLNLHACLNSVLNLVMFFSFCCWKIKKKKREGEFEEEEEGKTCNNADLVFVNKEKNKGSGTIGQVEVKPLAKRTRRNSSLQLQKTNKEEKKIVSNVSSPLYTIYISFVSWNLYANLSSV